MWRVLLSLVSVLLVTNVARTNAQLTLRVLPERKADGSPHYSHYASDPSIWWLKGVNPALWWGVFSFDDVNQVCKQLETTDNIWMSATVDYCGLTTQTPILQFHFLGRCVSRRDGSEESWSGAVGFGSDAHGYRMFCPHNAASVGCGVFSIATDASSSPDLPDDSLNNQGVARPKLETGSWKLTCPLKLLENCRTAAVIGAQIGVSTVALEVGHCFSLGFPLGVYCAIGAFVYGVGVGTAAGCATSRAFTAVKSKLLSNGTT